MKLGISYNVFDSEELLEGSINQIKKLASFISVVYQKKSNYGNDCSDNLENVLFDLKDRDLNFIVNFLVATLVTFNVIYDG